MLAAATGGIVGALKNAGHTEEEANVYSEGVRHGGTLVSVRTDNMDAGQIESLLDANRSVDASTRGAAYSQSGWNTFDPNAANYTAEEVTRERSAYTTTARH